RAPFNYCVGKLNLITFRRRIGRIVNASQGNLRARRSDVSTRLELQSFKFTIWFERDSSLGRMCSGSRAFVNSRNLANKTELKRRNNIEIKLMDADISKRCSQTFWGAGFYWFYLRKPLLPSIQTRSFASFSPMPMMPPEQVPTPAEEN